MGGFPVSTNNSVLVFCQGLTSFALPPGTGLEWPISTVNEDAKMGLWKACVLFLRAMLIPKVRLAFENFALRQRLAVGKQSVKRPKLRPRDRVFWVLLSRRWPNWRSALTFVQPETVIRWHRQGFKLYWRWKSRAGKPGRPACTEFFLPDQARRSWESYRPAIALRSGHQDRRGGLPLDRIFSPPTASHWKVVAQRWMERHPVMFEAMRQAACNWRRGETWLNRAS